MHFPRIVLLTVLGARLFAPPLAATIDLNLDGISDIWATAHPEAGAPAADPDGDGASNLAESLAGTDPLSPTSHFAATTTTDAAGNLVLRWANVAGKHYTVEASTDLRTWLEFPCTQIPAGGHGHGFFLIVRDHNAGNAHLLERVDQFELGLLAQFFIERAQRLVEQ